MTEDEAKELARWIADNGWAESIFLTPNPTHNVSSFALIEQVASMAGLDPLTVGRWFNERQEEREQERAR